MRKNLTKKILNSLPQMFDSHGNPINRVKVANKIFDSIPQVERLDLLPFEKYIPFACSTCKYNEANKIGCIYEMTSEAMHQTIPAPDNCPLEY